MVEIGFILVVFMLHFDPTWLWSLSLGLSKSGYIPIVSNKYVIIFIIENACMLFPSILSDILRHWHGKMGNGQCRDRKYRGDRE